MRRIVLMGAMLLSSLVTGGCSFDESAPTVVDEPQVDGDDPDPDAGGEPVADLPVATGAEPPPPPCVDDDLDGFFVPNRDDAECGEIDCNDESAEVFPGQTEGFTMPTALTGFDYNCDGVETKLVLSPVGGECEAGFFSCEGTGWVDGEPACGDTGDRHVCELVGFSCVERDRESIVMPCN